MSFNASENYNRPGLARFLTVVRTNLASRHNMLPRILSGALAITVISVGISTSSIAGEDKTYRNPTVGGKLLDGCYSWPGPCNSFKQAQAFCKRKSWYDARDYVVVNKVGAFQAKRLGDGGTCTASCSVMKKVTCVSP